MLWGGLSSAPGPCQGLWLLIYPLPFGSSGGGFLGRSPGSCGTAVYILHLPANLALIICGTIAGFMPDVFTELL